MKNFNRNKTTKRNPFTIIFGGAGRRRSLLFNFRRGKFAPMRTKMQKFRRAAQGWRNQTFGRLMALRIRLKFKRRKPIRRFIK